MGALKGASVAQLREALLLSEAILGFLSGQGLLVNTSFGPRLDRAPLLRYYPFSASPLNTMTKPNGYDDAVPEHQCPVVAGWS
jgi:hypothetical protein